MTHDPRPHVHRRSRAIDRLRTLTASAAIAGVAGTAGFAVLAAATWSGDQTATGAAGALDLDGANQGVTTPNAAATPAPRVAPNQGTARTPTATAPRVARGSGTGHAASGGSH
jgi:hypothetical protein